MGMDRAEWHLHRCVDRCARLSSGRFIRLPSDRYVASQVWGIGGLWERRSNRKGAQMKLGRFRLSPAMVVAVVAVVLALGGVSWASIPDSSGVVHSCYKKENGQLRVIDTDRVRPAGTLRLP